MLIVKRPNSAPKAVDIGSLGKFGYESNSIIPKLTSANSNGFETSASSLWSNPSFWQHYFPFQYPEAKRTAQMDGGFIAGNTSLGNWIGLYKSSAGDFSVSKVVFGRGNDTVYPDYGNVLEYVLELYSDKFVTKIKSLTLTLDYAKAYVDPNGGWWSGFDLGETVSGVKAIKLISTKENGKAKWGNAYIRHFKIF